MAAFPLIVAEEAVGVIALFASEVDRFQGEEMQLLTELSGDVAFAIGYLEKQDKLDYLAYYDVLTGLANRRLFLERVSQFMRADDGSRHMLALGVIDLVRFKSINDSSGRPAGDMILRQVAEWLTVHLSSSSMLARVEGDRFAVVIPDVIRIGEVGQLMEKTLNALANHPFRINTGVFRITGYAGVAMFPQDGLDAETLIYSAEAALNRAKASGKACLFYTREITERAVGKLSLENQLRRALENEEFVLHYQAKKNVATGKLVGAEALLRWVDPQSGLVPPGRFVPMLEETGLIHEVGSWVLRTAVKDYLRWHAAGLDEFRIAVNVSTQQLRNHAFIEEIREVIRANPAAAAGLEMEITESLIMEDIPHSIASLQSLRDLGIHIAIDDFGTGFSSLSYLYKLPIDTLKIDRSFVSNMTASPEGLSLVSTIISLAHSLKLDVVAEGVETEEQSRLLRLLNCDVIQGHLYAVPIPAKLLEENYLKLTFNKIIER
jgi:diguanylate cyclase (GGDEF)-like protein